LPAKLSLLVTAPLIAGCKGNSGVPAGLCGDASEPLSGIAVLEVKDSPADSEAGIKFVRTLQSEIATREASLT
jgi:hypothetical protein